MHNDLVAAMLLLKISFLLPETSFTSRSTVQTLEQVTHRGVAAREDSVPKSASQAGYGVRYV